MAQWTVKLTGCATFTAGSKGGGLSWKRNQARPMAADDARLAYYHGKRQFDVQEVKPKPVPVAPSNRPKKAKKEKVAPVALPPADLGAEEAPPLAEPAPELDEGPPGPSLPDDAVLEKWVKPKLLELAEEYGLDVNTGMTKAEIRAEIDTIR